MSKNRKQGITPGSNNVYMRMYNTVKYVFIEYIIYVPWGTWTPERKLCHGKEVLKYPKQGAHKNRNSERSVAPASCYIS